MDATDQYGRYAVGRMETGLSPVQVHIVHGKGILRLDANTALMHAVHGTLVLGAPVGPSCLTGHPGFLLRTCAMQLQLTLDELYRILRRELLPGEVFALRKRYGDFFEVDGEFYDEVTGRALQPVPKSSI